MTIDSIKEEINSLAGNNPELYNTLNPTAKPALGVRIPKLREIAKRIAKEDYKWFLENNPLDTFEMESLQAFVIGYAKDDINVLLDYMRKFIPIIHDWSVNDSLCQTFKIARKYPKETFDCLMEYKNSKKEFEVRVVAVMLMSQFLNDEYIDRVIETLNSLYTDSYYSRMGVAWAVATVMAKYPGKCIQYMNSESNHLDDWTFNKSIQKMKESYRVDKTDIEKIKKRA